MIPTTLGIQQTEDGRYQVLKDGVPINKQFKTEHDAQIYIDTYRQVVARLHLPEPPDELPLDALTAEERAILGEG